MAVPKVVAKSHLANFQTYTVQMVNLLIRDSFPPPAWDFSLRTITRINVFVLGVSVADAVAAGGTWMPQQSVAVAQGAGFKNITA